MGTPAPEGQGDEESPVEELESVAMERHGHQKGCKDECSGGRGDQMYQMLLGAQLWCALKVDTDLAVWQSAVTLRSTVEAKAGYERTDPGDQEGRNWTQEAESTFSSSTAKNSGEVGPG